MNSNGSGGSRGCSYAEQRHSSNETLTGTVLKGGETVTIAAGKDITLSGSAISLDKGNRNLVAVGDVSVGAATATHVINSHETHSHNDEAKRANGIPVSQQPSAVLPNTDKRGNPQPGYQYQFTVLGSDGRPKTVIIRDDAAGHDYGEGNAQNRGPTSMILRETTMTTEMKVLSTLDAFADNDFVSLRRSVFPDNLCLGAAEWTMDRAGSSEPFAEVLDFVLKRVREQLNNYDCWLIIGDSVWLDDTRIVRYKKLFSSLKAQGMNFEAAPERVESFVEKDGKLKFFGAVRLNASVTPVVPLTMTPRSCTYIVARPTSSELQFPLSLGWTGDRNQDSCLIAMVADNSGVVFQRVGYFDDPEVGLVALASPSVLERIVG
jgi:hypothetical protein